MMNIKKDKKIKFSERPVKGKIQLALDKVNDGVEKKRQWHSMVMAELKNFQEFSLSGVRVVPTHPIHIDQETKMIEIRCVAFEIDTGIEIPHPDGRFQFERPPFKIYDGTWHKEEEEIVPNLIENVLDSFRQELVKAIVSTAGYIPPSFVPSPQPRFVLDDLGFRITTSGLSVAPPEVNGRFVSYGDPPPGEMWKEIE